jgi:uncharacterized protein with NRDE domain
MPEGPDPTKQSRGRLPLLAAEARTADQAAERLASEVAGGSYNPAWLLVGDRESLHYLAVEPEHPSGPQRLGPGIHVLENAPIDGPSVKVDHVRAALARAGAAGVSRWQAFADLLRDHTVAGLSEVPRFPDGRERLVATLAPCVHADGYGTRSSALVRVPEEADRPAEVLVSDGPPCTSPFVDAGGLWSSTGPV